MRKKKSSEELWQNCGRMFENNVMVRCMWNRCMDLLMEIERQYGMEKVRQVATFLWGVGLLDKRTLDLLQNDVVESVLSEEVK